MPNTVSEPAEYLGGSEIAVFRPITDDDRAEYFARYSNASLGRVKNLYVAWARAGNAMSPQCQQLNRLFSQCVDGNRIKVPQALEDPPEPLSAASPFILDTMHAASTQFIEAISTGLQNSLCEYGDDSLDVLNLLLSKDRVALSEFELLQMVRIAGHQFPGR